MSTPMIPWLSSYVEWVLVFWSFTPVTLSLKPLDRDVSDRIGKTLHTGVTLVTLLFLPGSGRSLYWTGG